MRPHAYEVAEEARAVYVFDPICKYLVEIFLEFEGRWDHDAYFLTRREAEEHAEVLKDYHMSVRIRRCEEVMA